MKKRLLASLLTLCMMASILPITALASDETGAEGGTPAVCAEGCILDAGHEGECKFACTKTEGCTLADGHEGDCIVPQVEPEDEKPEVDEPEEEKPEVEETKPETPTVPETPAVPTAPTTPVEPDEPTEPEGEVVPPVVTPVPVQPQVPVPVTSTPPTTTDDGVAPIDETVETPEVKNVAKIGGTQYTTLEDAITGAEAGATIELIDDVTISYSGTGTDTGALNIDKNLTINGNGKTVSASGFNVDNRKVHVFNITGGNVTIENITIDGAKNAQHGVHAFGNCNVTLNNVTAENSKGYGVVVNNGATVTATNVKTSGNGWGGINVDKANSTFTMKSGTLNEQYSVVIENQSSGANIIAKIEGGTFNNVILQNVNTNSGVKLEVSGGTFKGMVAEVTKSGDEITPIENPNKGMIVISGGTFSAPVPEAYCADGMKPIEGDENGKFTVGQPGETTAVAQITKGTETKYYTTLKEAVNAAENGDTVTLLKNITLNRQNAPVNQGAIDITRNITLDGNGKTITAGSDYGYNTGSKRGDTHVINIMSGANATIKNLTIDGKWSTSNAPRSGINVSSATATIENVTIKNCSTYGVTAGNSNVTIKSIVTSGNNWGGINVDNTVANATSTFVMESGTINEKNAVYFENKENGSTAATIKGGTFNGSVTVATGAKLSVEGGTFSNSVSPYVVDTLDYELKSGGKYTYYETLAKAERAAEPGDIITEIGVSSSKQCEVTLDYNRDKRDDEVTIVVAENSRIVLPTPPRYRGYTFRYWRDDNGDRYDDGDSYKVEKDVTLTARWEEDDSSSSSTSGDYAISVKSVKNGSVKVSPKSADRNDTVTITAKPDKGYELDELLITDKNGNEIDYKSKGSDKYTFKMPRSKVTIKVTFAKEGTKPVVSRLPFVDVPANVWYYDAVSYVYSNGMMIGTSAYTFDPYASLSRGMVAQIFYNLEGRPYVYGSAFADAQPGAWYTQAIAWASANGVVAGYPNGTFGPNDPITREQFIVILYNYAQAKGYSTSARKNLSGYSDAYQVSSYADAAMRWAVAEGLISEVGNGVLAPQSPATRAQVAETFMQFGREIMR